MAGERKKKELTPEEELRRNTAKFRLLTILGNAFRNLPDIGSKRLVTRHAPSALLESGTGVVVSAGPSLDKAIPWLIEQRSKLTLFAVNTAVGALQKHGIKPDVVVITEHIDLSAHVDLRAGERLVTILSAGKGAWEQADHVALDFQPWADRLGLDLNCPPLVQAGNCAPTAVSLAIEWGADPLILVGQDLAYTGGRAYASGAAWDETTVRETEDGLEFGHMESRQEACRASGVPMLPSKHTSHEIPAWGGEGTVLTTLDLTMQRHQFAALAGCWPERRFINATGGGCHIDNWEDVPFAELQLGPHRLALPECEQASDVEVATALATVREEMRMAEIISEDEVAGGKGGTWLQTARGLPILNTLCTPDWLNIQDRRGLSPKQSVTERYRAMGEAPKWMEKAIAGELGAAPEEEGEDDDGN